MNGKWVTAIGILSILAVSGCTTQPATRESKLPENFVIKFWHDATSAGASKSYSATLTFKKGKIADGNIRYEESSAYGNQITECVVNVPGMAWIDNSTNEACGEGLMFIARKVTMPDGSYTFTDSSYPPLTSEGVQRLIDEKIIVPISTDNPSCHDENCYKMTPQE